MLAAGNAVGGCAYKTFEGRVQAHVEGDPLARCSCGGDVSHHAHHITEKDLKRTVRTEAIGTIFERHAVGTHGDL